MEVVIYATAGFFAILIGMVVLFKFILDRSSKKILSAGVKNDGLTKKYHDVDTNKYTGLLFNLGLSVALVFSIMAFEWKQYDEQELVDLGKVETQVEEVIEIPPTEQVPPPPPKVVAPEIVEVPDEEEIEDNVDVDLNTEVSEEAVVEQVLVEEKPQVVEEEVEEIFTIVEEGAEPIGGYPAFYKFIQKELKYPSQARRMGVEGKVYIQFVVEKDGKITDVKVMKGVGAGCDEEAARVVGASPAWKAGKQRGRNVKQRIVLPIAFKLN